MRYIARQLGILAAPVVGRGTLRDAVYRVRRGVKSTFGEFTAEGLIARPVVDLFSRAGGRVITKIKHKDFLTCPR